ncbi:MAG TPA: TetR/AcrR family transcriptional regulator [Gaiellaceae bacterium]|nr:TetR/AcrR family transcriptional regulator [Gaiellaceae bacterium]
MELSRGRSRPDVRARHAAQREETHRRLLEATRALVEELPWSRVTIELIAERAGVTRTAFYKHFADQRAVLLDLLAETAAQLEAIPAAWEDAADESPETLLRHAVDVLVATFHEHGRLLQAFAEEAAHDDEVLRLYTELGGRLSAGVAERIMRDVAAGASSLADPEEVATALVWMNERFLRQRFGRHPLGDPERAAEALSQVWIRTVYGPRSNG